jgi:hypothetical protein
MTGNMDRRDILLSFYTDAFDLPEDFFIAGGRKDLARDSANHA